MYIFIYLVKPLPWKNIILHLTLSYSNHLTLPEKIVQPSKFNITLNSSSPNLQWPAILLDFSDKVVPPFFVTNILYLHYLLQLLTLLFSLHALCWWLWLTHFEREKKSEYELSHFLLSICRCVCSHPLFTNWNGRDTPALSKGQFFLVHWIAYPPSLFFKLL